MKLYVCEICRHEVLANSKPQPIKWSDVHICYFTDINLLEDNEDENIKEIKKL